MATTANPPPGAFALEDDNGSDPFVTNSHDAQRQRYSAFDTSQFSLYLNGSPAQAKRALQAHLAETTRRLQETSHLGNALVQQRKELEEKIQEVEKQRQDNDIGPELRQRLAELEKEFNEVGRETARAFLPKSRVASGETDSTAGASVYSTEALHSPSKISVPSRKQRNQQPTRIHDVALATEISTSLLAQLKDLQAVLLEKDDALKAADLDRSQLEIEVEGLSQRLRTLDESESRLKDVNWNLETQVREFEAQFKATADKEHRLAQNLTIARSEKSTLEREFEELKQLYAKLNDDHSSSTKHHETELSGMRRNVSMGETERGALQRKVDELATQNQELARAVAYRMRTEDHATAGDTSPDDGVGEGDTITPEHSPPPSPSKATPRHGQLESETLKHSLNHAHRMIQQLKNNIHREKTEKIELKRMLLDARDELESNRNSTNAPGSANKRKKNDKDVFKKPARPDRLGALRSGAQEIVVDDDDWEEQDIPQSTPSRRSRHMDVVPGAFSGGFGSAAETSGNEGFETANETGDAFETANERDGTATETDAFQTGAETLDGDSTDELTETEAGPITGTIRSQRPSSLALTGHRDSYESTASTSGDDDDVMDVKTPIQPQHPRYRLKVRQGNFRRSTPRSSQELFASTPPTTKDSPASNVSNSNNSTPAQGKSLFAELGALSGESEDGSVADGTPSRTSLLSPESSPEASRRFFVNRSPQDSVIHLKPAMVNSSMMTEPWLPAPSAPRADSGTDRITPERMAISSVSAQGTQPEGAISKAPSLYLSEVTTLRTEPQSAVRPPLRISDVSAQGTLPRYPPPPALHLSGVSTQDTTPQRPPSLSLTVSSVSTQDSVPRSPVVPLLNLSTISAKGTEPVAPVITKTIPFLDVSSFAQQMTEPSAPSPLRSFAPTPLLVSSISTQATEPSASGRTAPTVLEISAPSSQLSSFSSQITDPVESDPVEQPKRVPLQTSAFSAQTTQPTDAPKPASLKLSTVSSQTTQPTEAKYAHPQFSVISAQFTEPAEPIRQTSPQLSTLSVQSTEPTEPHRSAPSQFSALSSQAVVPVDMPKRAPSQVSSITVQGTEPVEPSMTPRPRTSLSNMMILHDTQPESPTLPAFLPSPSRPSIGHRAVMAPLEFSDIVFQETEPQLPSRPVTAHRTVAPMFPTSTTTQEVENTEKPNAGILGYFSSVLPGHKNTLMKDTTLESTPTGSRDGRMPLAPISSSTVQMERGLSDRRPSPVKTPRTPTADEATQTMVSSDQIDRLLLARSHRYSGTIATAGVEKRFSPPGSPSRSPVRTPRRPGSSGSMRSRAASPPPLPADHKQVIAAAALKVPLVPGSAPPSAPPTPGTMGPPVLPASAYKKRPQTPTIRTHDVPSSPKTGGTTPRPRYPSQRGDGRRGVRSGASSPISRRTSVSSFASEVDTRFGGIQAPNFSQSGLDPNTTDPRMIQAITQTMIGEFLWKYTRKAGREGMSENRHRRFFWVHPYTRTLYWSEQDPATAGRAQLKAKSVAIEAVQVVTDDNPLPPGLHRKSLVVITPGRTIKFTATTGQRHETWFNALSYLLLRTGEDHGGPKNGTDEIQNEFNPGYRSMSRQTGRSRASLSSYISRRTSSPQRAQIPTLRQSPSTQNASSSDPKHGSMSGRLSGLSMFRPASTIRGSFSSRRSRASTQEVVPYEEPNESVVGLSREIVENGEREHASNGLEMVNVRACCDGKHDVAHLHAHQHSAKGRHNSYTANSRSSVMGSISSRSQSRASGRDDQIRGQTEMESSNSSAGY